MANPIDKLKTLPIVKVKSTFHGTIKKLFIEDLERGEKASDLLRQMAKCFYETKDKINNKY